MSPNLVFMMGEFRAEFPTDRLYAKNHMWAAEQKSRLWRFGFSSYAVRLLQDVYFLDFHVEPGATITKSQEMGEIESKKAESGLYAPVSGTLVSLNQDLLSDPSGINVDKYESGWLFEIETDGDSLVEPEAYLIHLESAWDVAQKTIKGQVNA